MGTQTFSVSGKKNFKGGAYNKGGSQLIGWDSGKVRAEQWKFTTKEWPVTQISFTIHTSVNQGSNIKIRCGISTSSSSYTNSSGSSSGYAVTKNGKTTIKKSLSPNTTYYIVFFPGVSKSTFGLLNAESLSSITATVTDRTACSAPIEITLEPVVQSIEGPATLSWSGAVAGRNVPIASYEIFRAGAPDATDWESIGQTSDAETTTYNVTAPSSSQASYFYKVKTIASIAGYDSDLSLVYAQLTANLPPDAPTIQTVSQTIVPSFGGDVTFSVAPGQSYKEDPTTSLWYSTSPSGEKIQFISPLTVSVSTDTTYYFYTYDGTDYSQPVSQAIEVNVKPVINSVTGTAIIYRALGSTGEGNNQLGYSRTIAPTITTNKIANVRVFLEYYALPEDAEEDNVWDSYDVQIQSEPILEVSSSIGLGSCNIHQWIDKSWKGKTTIHWRLRFILNDGIEDSESAYFPHDSETLVANDKYYAIAHAPSVIEKYNQFNTEDISGTVQYQIWKEVRLKVSYDESMTEATAFALADKQYEAVCVLRTDSNVPHQFYYIDITLPDGIPNGITVRIDASLKSQNVIKEIEEVTVTETKAPYFTILEYNAGIIKPFTDSGTFQVNSVWPFVGYENLETGLPAYNCPTTNVFKLVYSSSNKGDGANRVVKNSLTWTKDGSNLTTTLNKANVYEWQDPKSLGYTTYAGKQPYYCRLEITNLFGKTFSTPWIDRKFDFDEKAGDDLKVSSIEYSTDYNESDPSLATWRSIEDKAIQEGVYLRFTCDFKLYTSDKVTATILVSSSNLVEREVVVVNYNADKLERADDNSGPAQNQEQYIYKVGEIKDTNDRIWKIKITNNAGSVTSTLANSKQTPVTRQTEPDINFIKCLISKTYEINYEFEITDTGGGTLKYCLCDEDDNKRQLSTLTNVSTGTTTGDITLSPTPSWNSRRISVKIESTVNGLISNIKEYYSNVILAYQVTPTVAYRLNSIGINVNDPEPDAAIDVHQAGSNSKVFIQGQDSNNTATKFEIDVTTGLIKFYKGNSATPISTLDFINKIWT